MPSRIGGQLIPPNWAVSGSFTGGHNHTPVAYYPSSDGQTKSGLPAGMKYTVCDVDDGTLSCDCMGWTRRNPPGGRTCKHTEDYQNYLVLDKTAPQPKPVPVTSHQETTSTKGGTLQEIFAHIDKEKSHA